MMGSWLFLWVIFMFLLMAQVAYGWSYRGWGPPYPRYIQRRLGAQAAIQKGGLDSFNHYAWGLGGDLLWIAFLVAGVWVASALMSR